MNKMCTPCPTTPGCTFLFEIESSAYVNLLSEAAYAILGSGVSLKGVVKGSRAILQRFFLILKCAHCFITQSGAKNRAIV
jgi:hypothetical protein